MYTAVFYLLLLKSIPAEAFERREISRETHVPMYFRPSMNGIEIGGGFFEYDFSSLRSPQIGPYRFLFSDFQVHFTTLFLGYAATTRYKYAHVLSVNWPKGFVKEGRLTLETFDGLSIIEEDFNSDTEAQWKELREALHAGKKPEGVDWNAETVKVRPGTRIPNHRWGKLLVRRSEYPGFRRPFRFCLVDKGEHSDVKVCSAYLRLGSGGKVRLRKWERVNPDGLIVYVDGVPAPVFGKVRAEDQEKISFRALFDNGMVIEFQRKTKQNTVFEEVVADETTGEIYVTGRGDKPARAYWNIKGAPPVSLWRLRYFEKTYGQTRYYWELKLPAGSKSITVGKHGVDAFSYPMSYQKLPPKSARVYLKKLREETYGRFPRLTGYLDAGQRISAEAPSEIDFDPADGFFDWEYYAEKKGEFNSGILNVKTGGKTWKATHDIYRGHSADASLRLQTLATGLGSLSVLGEASANYWLEDLFGWQHNWLSIQRWGVGVNYFQSFLPFAISADATVDVSVFDFSLRYRFNQGLWGRSETLGLKMDYQAVDFGGTDAAMIGAGLFWARSMPKIFDDILNIVPFLRYPKHVDADFLWFFSSQDSQVSLGNNLAVNFHGKILWTPSFFAELGTGAKQYDFTNFRVGKKVNVTLFYATLGVGLNF